jgi:uncharacterized protein YigA (DUF484 family)
MKRLLALVLLMGLTASCAIPLHAQQMSVAEYQRKSAKESRKEQKLMKKNARLQQKAQKRAVKAQQKSLKAAQKADAKVRVEESTTGCRCSLAVSAVSSFVPV